MSSSDFPDGSRENPAIIPDTDADADDEAPSFNFADGSRENPAIIPESDSDDEAPSFGFSDLDRSFQVADVIQNLELSLGLRNREDERRMSDMHAAETSNDQSRRLAAESAKQQFKEAAKCFAFELHSVQSPNIVKKLRKEDEEVKGKGKSQFKEAKEAIEKRRRDSISSSGIDLNLFTHRKAPTLTEMTLRVLADNSEAIKSLFLVPEHLKKKLSNRVSNIGKLNKRFMQLLIQDSPSEIFVRNCVDLDSDDLTRILCDCDRVSLKVLNLDLCGRAMTDNAITEFLKRSPNGFPSLTTLSLQGSFCLSDNALALISRSAPFLLVINLSECSHLTFQAVKILADNFGSTLRGLNIGGCQGIKRSNDFKSSLSKFSKLNYLSVANLESINDEVIEFLVYHGSNLTDLSLASCNEVTDYAIWTIGKYCPKLEALDISDMDKLTDKSLEYITDGCRSLNSVKLTKNRFSDEAVSAFLEVCGGSINDLCLNNVRDVGHNTAISLAKNCRRLRYLDLSWCRKFTEEQLRRILSCCLLLRSLKLFGWTQVNDKFLEELSRSEAQITGLKMTSVFAYLDDSFSGVEAKF